MTQAYPLHWPDGWPRTASPGKSQFKASLAGALGNVTDSLRLFAKDSGKKVETVVISSNYSLGDPSPKDPGVAVYFSWDGISTCLAVDRYASIRENLQAIHHCVDAERTKLRHGGINLVRAAFRGYAALPPPSADWRRLLDNSKTLADAEGHYRAVAKSIAAKGGHNSAAMYELNAAVATARKELG